MHPAEDQIQFGCQMADVICMSFESQARGLASFMGWLSEKVLGSQDLAPGSTLWDAAIGETSNWLAIGILVSVGIAIIGLATGAISMSAKKVGWSLFGILTGIPATLIALTLGGALLTWSDEISDAVLKRFSGEDGFKNLFRAVLQGGTGSDAAGMALGFISGGTQASLPTLLMLILCIAGLMFMAVALAFRNLALMVLIAFSPLAFSSVAVKGGWRVPRKWGLAGIALLISKPLMFGIIAMLLKASDGMALFSPQTLTVVTGLFIASFMPMMAYSFFNFLGASAENEAGGNVGTPAAQKVQQGGRSLVDAGKRAFGGVRSGGGGSGSGPQGASGKSPKPTKTPSNAPSQEPKNGKQPGSRPQAETPSTPPESGGQNPAGGNDGRNGSSPGPTQQGAPGQNGGSGVPGANGPSTPQVPDAPPQSPNGGGSQSPPLPAAPAKRW